MINVSQIIQQNMSLGRLSQQKGLSQTKRLPCKWNGVDLAFQSCRRLISGSPTAQFSAKKKTFCLKLHDDGKKTIFLSRFGSWKIFAAAKSSRGNKWTCSVFCCFMCHQQRLKRTNARACQKFADMVKTTEVFIRGCVLSPGGCCGLHQTLDNTVKWWPPQTDRTLGKTPRSERLSLESSFRFSFSASFKGHIKWLFMGSCNRQVPTSHLN